MMNHKENGCLRTSCNIVHSFPLPHLLLDHPFRLTVILGSRLVETQWSLDFISLFYHYLTDRVGLH